MIAKIRSSNTLYGALAYNQNKLDDRHAQVIHTNKMIEPKDGNFDIPTCLQSFENYLLSNRRTEKPVIHISLNPDPKDQLSDEQLSAIAQTYMQKMGYGDQPFIVYLHEDIERRHIHIVSLRVDETGKKIDHNFERRRSMAVCRELEHKYGLVPAEKKRQKEGLPLKKVDYKKGDVKNQIANVIRSIATEYLFLSLKEYKALLSIYNVGMEEIRGKINGKEYKGLIYSALNDKGEKVGNPFKSSLFGKSVGIEELEKRIEQSAKTIKNKNLKARSKQLIAAAMRSTNNRSKFEKALEKQRISVLFRTHEQGRIYGATFIDHEQKVVFNGSRLGKEFAANVFNDLFNAKCPNRDLQDYKITAKTELEPVQSCNQDNQASGIAGIFDLFTPDTSISDEIEEQSLARRMKKRRKGQRKI
ncbi:MAG: relaxase/mobilization nuclease domain-containing protein [Prevotellaceae bacterium]|jgi:hypothetical protein|nr:relaxase/mobilization nuclease domain-containing protein [Prevotellaceae bacterium]